jgi:hypothetical protein
LADTDPNSLDDAIRDNAVSPSKASVDGQSVEQHGLSEQIAVDRYLASKRAVARRGLGIKTTKLVPPGAA